MVDCPRQPHDGLLVAGGRAASGTADAETVALHAVVVDDKPETRVDEDMADVFLAVYARNMEIPLIRCAGHEKLAVDINGVLEDSIFTHSSENRPTKFNMRDAVNSYLQKHWKTKPGKAIINN